MKLNGDLRVLCSTLTLPAYLAIPLAGIFMLLGTGRPPNISSSCADLSWSTPADLPGRPSPLVRFGSIESDRSRGIFVGSAFRNFLRDTLSGSWVAYDTHGDVIPPPPGPPHWLPRVRMTAGRRLWAVWANTVATGPIPLTRLFGAPMRAVHTARWSGTAWEAHQSLIANADGGHLVWDGEGDPVAVDADNRVHVILQRSPVLWHVRYDGVALERSVLLEQNAFSPSIAVRGDTLLVAAIGARPSSGPRVLWLTGSDDTGDTWWDPIPLDVDLLGLVQYLTVLWNDGPPVLLWTQGIHEGSRRDLLRGLTLDVGSMEGQPIPDMQLPGGSSHLEARADACGNVHVVFLRTTGDGRKALHYARYSDSDGWHRSRITSPEVGVMTEAMLGGVGEELWAVWAEGTGPEALTMRYSRLSVPTLRRGG